MGRELMSEFTKVSQNVERLKFLSEELAAEVDGTSGKDVSVTILKFKEFSDTIQVDFPKVARMKGRLLEKDPEKRTYGEQMSAKVQELVDQYDDLYEIYEESMKPRFEHLVLLEQQKEQRRKQQELDSDELEYHERLRKAREDTTAEEEERMFKLQRDKQREEELKEKQEEALRLEKEEQEQKMALRIQSIIVGLSNELSLIDTNNSTLPEVLELGLSRLSSSSLGDFRQVCSDLSNVLSKIISAPETTMFRFIRVANESFQNTLGRKAGAILALRSVGFQLYPFEKLKDVIARVYGKQTAEEKLRGEVFLYLPEPRLNDFDGWILWRSRLHLVCDILDRIVRETGNLTASEASTPANHRWGEREIREVVHTTFKGLQTSVFEGKLGAVDSPGIHDDEEDEN
eukprot:GDKK01058285.1.p1 GENE.GDKK01058285.1~~GDKK01058285.1.p1  ORF type:complete len:402 (+),score=89.27 GDKK01058285.1:1-1206(+)